MSPVALARRPVVLACALGLLAGCGGDATDGFTLGTYDEALRVTTFRVRCQAGAFIGSISPTDAGDSGPISDVRLLRWDLEAGTLTDFGDAEASSTSWTVDAAEVGCDAPGTALVAVPLGDAHFGPPELEVGVPGVLNGGGARDQTLPVTLVVSEVGDAAASVTVYLYDLVGDSALTPVPLTRTGPGNWDAAWNGTLAPGYLMGAIARDSAGAVIGTFGL
jgi:hypothetical protein